MTRARRTAGPKLNNEKIGEIQAAAGSLRQIARQYGVSHSEIARIKNGTRTAKTPTAVEQLYKTPFGTLAQPKLVRQKGKKYWVSLCLTATEAAPIVQRVDEAIYAQLATVLAAAEAMPWNEDDDDGMSMEDEKKYLLLETKAAKGRPYKQQEDGSYILTFQSKQPRFRTLDGTRSSETRKPRQVREGRKLALVYSVESWYWPATEIDPATVGARLCFVQANVRRQRIR